MEIAIALDDRSPAPLHRRLYDEIRRSILSGRLSPGSRVPSTRALASSLGVSRSTVTQSYEQLISEGYLQTVFGSGTKVCEQLPDDLLRTASVKPIKARAKRPPTQPVKLSLYGASLNDDTPLEAPEQELSLNFKTGCPALDEFPMQQWRRLLSKHCRTDPRRLLDYAASPCGDAALREAIAGYLARSRAVRCSPDQVVIVNGSQQAIDLVTKVLIDRGDKVAIENPGYLGARRAFLAQGAKLHPAPVDHSGIVVEKLAARSANRIKAVYVTPSHQFPTGAVLSLPRRLELLGWSANSGAVIIEDDYDSEFRYGSRPIPALQGLAESENVIYVGTFSKVLFPSLRAGYLVVPETLARIFGRARWLADRHTPTLEQRVLADFINEGQLERHLRRMRTLYDRRRQALVRALEAHFGDHVTILGENAGMHLMIRLRSRFSDEQVVERARRAGVGIVSARIYYLGEGRKDEFVLGYAALSERRIREGVRQLAGVLK
jgi:GntR family transcriptional regulator/MocR family aminotransferase